MRLDTETELDNNRGTPMGAMTQRGGSKSAVREATINLSRTF